MSSAAATAARSTSAEEAAAARRELNALRLWVGGGCAVGAALGVGVVGAYVSADDAGRSRVAFAVFDALAYVSSMLLDPEAAHRLVCARSRALNAL